MKNVKEKFDVMIKKLNADKIDQAGKNLAGFAAGFLMTFAEWIKIAAVGLFLSVFIGLIVFKIMAVGGLAVIFGDLMANTCINLSLPCDVNILMGGLGFSLVFLTTFFIIFSRLFFLFENIKTVTFEDDYIQEPSRVYSEEMVKVLRTIQGLGGCENLLSLANFQGVPYTTMRNYINQYESDGYIAVSRNGQGSPITISLIQ